MVVGSCLGRNFIERAGVSLVWLNAAAARRAIRHRADPCQSFQRQSRIHHTPPVCPTIHPIHKHLLWTLIYCNVAFYNFSTPAGRTSGLALLLAPSAWAFSLRKPPPVTQPRPVTTRGGMQCNTLFFPVDVAPDKGTLNSGSPKTNPRASAPSVVS